MPMSILLLTSKISIQLFFTSSTSVETLFLVSLFSSFVSGVFLILLRKSIFIRAALKFLLDNFKIAVISVLAFIDYLFKFSLRFPWFLV